MVCSNLFKNVYHNILGHQDLSRASCSVSGDAFLLIQWVEVADHLVEAGGVKMRIDLGGLNTGMAEQLLQHAQIGTAGVHVGGKGMP